MEKSKSGITYQLGVSIFLLLAFLTAAEYFVATEFSSKSGKS